MTKLLRPRLCVLWLCAISLLVWGCSNEMLSEQQTTEALNSSLTSKNDKDKKDKLHFNTTLKGENEVPARETSAVGECIVAISKDETSIHFKLIVANVQTNITGAHFHMGPAGANAGVVVNLLNISDTTPETTAPVNGILAEGTITASKLSGALKDKPLSDLIAAMRAGNIYVNTHTTTYPGGEIRGQL